MIKWILGLLSRRPRETTVILVELPTTYLAAIDTIIWLYDKDGLLDMRRDDVIMTALYGFLSENVWATKKITESHTQIRRATDPTDLLGPGRIQSR